MTKLDELKAALLRATPGERVIDDGFATDMQTQADYLIEGIGTDLEWVAIGVEDEDGFAAVVALAHPTNAQAIALAHNLMPTLLEAVEAAQNLVAMKGRYNTEIAYGRLEQILEKLK